MAKEWNADNVDSIEDIEGGWLVKGHTKQRGVVARSLFEKIIRAMIPSSFATIIIMWQAFENAVQGAALHGDVININEGILIGCLLYGILMAIGLLVQIKSTSQGIIEVPFEEVILRNQNAATETEVAV